MAISVSATMGPMRDSIRTGCGLLFAALLAASCGGSSSETPWPVEPETTTLGPAGESGPGAFHERAEPADAGPAADDQAGSTDTGAARPRLRRAP